MDTITLTGDISAVDALDLKVRLQDAVMQPRPVVRVDLRGVEHLNLAALSALVAAGRAAERARGQLHVLPPTRTEPRKVLALAGCFDTETDVAAAA